MKLKPKSGEDARTPPVVKRQFLMFKPIRQLTKQLSTGELAGSVDPAHQTVKAFSHNDLQRDTPLLGSYHSAIDISLDSKLHQTNFFNDE